LRCVVSMPKIEIGMSIMYMGFRESLCGKITQLDEHGIIITWDKAGGCFALNFQGSDWFWARSSIMCGEY